MACTSRPPPPLRSYFCSFVQLLTSPRPLLIFFFLRPPDAPSMLVVSGIAVSFDGKTSQYLSLPPLLPRRPTEWHQALLCAGDQASDGCIANSDGGGGNLPTGRCSEVAAGLASSASYAGSAANEAELNRPAMRQKGGGSRETAVGVTGGRKGDMVSTCWEALPRRAVEAVALFVSWLMVSLYRFDTVMLLWRNNCVDNSKKEKKQCLSLLLTGYGWLLVSSVGSSRTRQQCLLPIYLFLPTS